jgi:hypothetical protein
MRAAERHDLELSSRIARFIRGQEGADIGCLIDMLEPVGEVGIFGGMPRDFARASGGGPFDSDVDVVVDAPADALDEVLHPMGADRNRFGGYRLRHGRFDFDIWALERTWAVSTGHVAVRSLTDLVKTTFFDCDAVVYHCRSGTISRSNSFWSNLHRGIVDINLQANPHQVGTLARTLRILFDWQQDLSPKLAEYLVTGLAEHGVAVMQYARASAGNYRFAREVDLEVALKNLRHHKTWNGLQSARVAGGGQCSVIKSRNCRAVENTGENEPPS